MENQTNYQQWPQWHPWQQGPQAQQPPFGPWAYPGPWGYRQPGGPGSPSAQQDEQQNKSGEPGETGKSREEFGGQYGDPGAHAPGSHGWQFSANPFWSWSNPAGWQGWPNGSFESPWQQPWWQYPQGWQQPWWQYPQGWQQPWWQYPQGWQQPWGQPQGQSTPWHRGGPWNFGRGWDYGPQYGWCGGPPSGRRFQQPWGFWGPESAGYGFKPQSPWRTGWPYSQYQNPWHQGYPSGSWSYGFGSWPHWQTCNHEPRWYSPYGSYFGSLQSHGYGYPWFWNRGTSPWWYEYVNVPGGEFGFAA